MPIFVSIILISFMTYVMLGNQLTISTTFTVHHSLSGFLKIFSMPISILPRSQAIALFNMVRPPLNVIPVSHFSPPWCVINLTSVALKHVAVYLKEDEVTDQRWACPSKCIVPHSYGWTLNGTFAQLLQFVPVLIITSFSIFILDELDHITPGTQSLTSIFTLTKAASAVLQLIGIANTHTLTSSSSLNAFLPSSNV